MRYRDAKKLYKNDEIKIKETGFVETVSFIECHGDDVYIFTNEGSDYHHTSVDKNNIVNKNNDLSPELTKELDYEYSIRNKIISLALVKPPVSYSEKRKVNLITKLLKEYGII